MRIAHTIILTPEDQAQLYKWSKGRSTAVQLMQRAKIILLASEGLENIEIASQLNINRRTVSRWRTRFAKSGIEAITHDAPRSGRIPTKRNENVRRIIDTVTLKKPDNATHWSVRTLAKNLHLSNSMVHRVMKASNLKPHLSRTFKVSNDKQFVDKTIDVVGLYLDPPENSRVICVDEKTQIQALDRTQPGLPFKKGRCGTMTHDYKRNGTTTLFAGLDVATGEIIGECTKRHRHQEYISFLKRIEKETPKELDIHIIVDNYAAHKHMNVQKWLKRNERIHIHYTPTSSSWMNLVERWFRNLTDKQIRRGVFHSVDDLKRVIMTYIEKYNMDCKPFIWTATAEAIIEKVRRARQVLDMIPSE